MDTISSAKFRVTYQRLHEPVMVTANGHPIGRWVPYPQPGPGVEEAVDRIAVVGTAINRMAVVIKRSGEEAAQAARSFTPVPKPTRRK
jgi:hypothetical protein